MLHPQKARVAAREAKRALARMARPADGFDSNRYFRGPIDVGFYNVATAARRALARSIYTEHKDDWSLERYAIERFPERKRRAILQATRTKDQAPRTRDQDGK